MKDMTTLEIVMMILSFVLTVAVPIGVKAFIQIKGTKLAEEDRKRLEFVATQAISAAEEMGKREGWSSAQKLSFAQDTIKGAFPDLDTSSIDLAIHAALAVSQFASAVNK